MAPLTRGSRYDLAGRPPCRSYSKSGSGLPVRKKCWTRDRTGSRLTARPMSFWSGDLVRQARGVPKIGRNLVKRVCPPEIRFRRPSLPDACHNPSFYGIFCVMSDYLRFFFLLAAAWINRDQQHRMQIIDYLIGEIRVYQELCKGYRLRFTDKQRRRLSVKAKALVRKTLEQFASLVTLDTLLRWFRSLIAREYDGTVQRRGRGRPRKRDGMADLVVEMANKNQSWGYTRIRGARPGAPGKGRPASSPSV